MGGVRLTRKIQELAHTEHKFFDFDSEATLCVAPSIAGLGFNLLTRNN